MYQNQQSISDYYKQSFEKAKLEMLKETDKTVLGTKTEELTQYYFQKYALQIVEIDESRELEFEHEKYIKTIRARERDPFYRSEGDLEMECERIQVDIPLMPNKNIHKIIKLRSSTFSLSSLEREYEFTRDNISFFVETKGYRLSLNEDQIAREVENKIEFIKQFISWKKNDIEIGNILLRSQITQLISERKSKLEQDKSIIASLSKRINIPLKKKENSFAKKITISETPLVRRIKPKPVTPEEYVLDSQKVIDIIEYLNNQGRQFEKTPSAYKTMGEEDLRNVLLVNLNAVFEGNATGETFSKKGKSDIYLQIAKGNILVFECKIWGGAKLYNQTIDQLRGYVTWRHNFGVMITFARNKNFSDVVNQTEDILKKSNSYKGGYSKKNSTHFVSRHQLEDENKEIEIHHLFYNLYA